jgi:hypothetical protein
MSPDGVRLTAQLLGLEVVPQFSEEEWSVEVIDRYMKTLSCLGGQPIEGIVFKNYQRFGKDGKALMGKHVSEAFREVHKGAWKESNPGRADVIERLITSLRTPARFQKAVQHLREQGSLEGTPRDIGALIQEARRDIEEEAREYIAEELLKHFLPQVLRGATAGLPEWYKRELMAAQFPPENADGSGMMYEGSPPYA